MNMDIKELAEGVSVAGQIFPEDAAELAGLGYRSVICNRPDGEVPGQPTFAEVEAALTAAGLQSRYVPIVPKLAGIADAQDFKDALETLPGPILAYCRSGARTTAMFNAVKAGVAG